MNIVASNMNPKTRNSGRWTEARFRGFIKSLLRRGTTRWGPKIDTLNKAYVKRDINPKSGRMAKLYQCNKCKELFPLTDVEVDHIIPIMEIDIAWDEVIDKMFCEEDNLQVLCKNCHYEKTQEERKKYGKKSNEVGRENHRQSGSGCTRRHCSLLEPVSKLRTDS